MSTSGRSEDSVDHVRDDVGPAGEVAIQGGGARIQALCDRSHRERLGALFVDDCQCGRDDSLHWKRGPTRRTPPHMLLFCHGNDP